MQVNEVPRPDLLVKALGKYADKEDVAVLDYETVANETREAFLHALSARTVSKSARRFLALVSFALPYAQSKHW